MAMGRRNGCLTAIIVFLAVVIAAAVSIYIFLPGMFRPYDLGVKTSEQAYNSAINKLNFTKDTAPKTGVPKDYKIKYGKPHKVNIALSNEEVTSFINFNRPDYYALKNFQFRVNPDNTVESTGTLNTSYVFSKILKGKYNNDDASKIFPMIKILPNVNFYFKFAGGVKNNKISNLEVQKVGIMGISIPTNLVNSDNAISFIKENLDSYINSTNKESGSSYGLVQAANEKLQFKGTIPSSIEHIKVN
ncbi:MAG: hypothetical protein WC677_06345 [Clostridia bacterium]|jgi:hypothetical protein